VGGARKPTLITTNFWRNLISIWQNCLFPIISMRLTDAACQAGKHVSDQKPMALTVAECDQMIEAARRHNVLLKVFENFVFYPTFVRAKVLIDAGEIGVPQMIRLHMNTGTRDSAWDAH
jgi:predicted dehydrogenase